MLRILYLCMRIGKPTPLVSQIYMRMLNQQPFEDLSKEQCYSKAIDAVYRYIPYADTQCTFSELAKRTGLTKYTCRALTHTQERYNDSHK
jgi:hypothetical protein